MFGHGIYTFHLPAGGVPLDRAVALREGFCWPAALFGVLWLGYRGLWPWAAAHLLAGGVIAALIVADLLAPAFAASLILALQLLVGFHANDWRRARLERAGFRFAGLAAARDRTEADRRFFDGLRGTPDSIPKFPWQ